MKCHIVSLLVGVCLCSGLTISAQEADYKLKGNVTQLRIKEGPTAYSPHGDISFGSSPLQKIVSFTHGRPTKKETYRNGNLVDTETFAYNANGELTETKITSPYVQSGYQSKVAYRYANHHCTQKQYYNTFQEIKQTDKITYNAATRTELCDVYYGERRAEQIENQYDDKGRLTSTITYKFRSGNRIVYYKAEFFYDERGLLREQRYSFPSSSSKITVIEYRYKQFDKQGNWLKRLQVERVAEGIIPRSMTLRKIEYAP